MASNDRNSLATKLYRGEVSYDIIGKRRRWYAASGIVILIGILSLALRGLNPSIDFKGGAQFQGPFNGHSIADVRGAFTAVGIDPQSAEMTGSGASARFQVQTKTLTQVGPTSQVVRAETSVAQRLGIDRSAINVSTVGSTWGGQITNKAVLGLVIFLVAVVIYLSIRFEWQMALAATIALLHDLVITAGIYSLTGLEVSPATVIAVLTILGYSLYDTVVVFDKVRENTAGILGGSRMTYTQAANLAVNQTLVRSINTSVIALLPVIGLIVIGAGVLGAGSLDDLAVALLIGLAAGAYSSIFIATPLLCDVKEREPANQQLARRVSTRVAKESRVPAMQPVTVGAPSGAVTPPAPTAPKAPTAPTGTAGASSSSLSVPPTDTADADDLPAAAEPPAVARPPRPARPAGAGQRRGGSRPGGRGRSSRKRRR